MFKFFCLLALACTAMAASIESTTERREVIPLLKFDLENNKDGSFQFTYEGGDKSFREEAAHVINEGTEDQALEVTGSYRYIDEDGKEVEVHYTAGKNGFVPIGTNISPEISEAARLAAENPIDEKEQLRHKSKSN